MLLIQYTQKIALLGWHGDLFCLVVKNFESLLRLRIVKPTFKRSAQNFHRPCHRV
jgi:hypothetical protein